MGGALRNSFVGAAVGGAVGGAIGSATASITSPTSSAFSDIIGETLGGYGYQLLDAALGDRASDVLAKRAARDETANAFLYAAGKADQITPQMRSYFGQSLAVKQVEERGRMLFNMDPEMRVNLIDELMDKIEDILEGVLNRAVSRLAEAINPFSSSDSR